MPHIHDIAAIDIDIEALDAVPESVARESCILPVTLGESSLHIIHPVDADLAPTVDKLQFILNRTITVDTGDRHAIEAAINRLYPTPRQEAEKLILPDALPELDTTSDFAFLDLLGQITFSTAASVSFHLGRKTDYLEYSDGTRNHVGKDRVFNVVGWLDIHYPCKGFHKLIVRCSLPGDYVSYESMRDLIRQTCDVLALPDNVPYKMHLQADGNATSMENPQEGFVCTTKWRPPDERE